ncbi:MAG: hypothetical protein Q8914_01715, partial [Bacteroidota bacterium]|nr:hypothetical protein [Bacteroidota bacterium]
MRYKLLVFCLLVFSPLLAIAANRQIKVALIVNTQKGQNDEAAALKKLIEGQSEEFTCQIVSMNHLADVKKCNLVWYQRTDSSDITRLEKKAKKILTRYVENGGQLILSMDAVRLLNEWKIEPESIQIGHHAAIDEGFGREIGFHGYRQHPLFFNMFGGAFPFQGKVDENCRLLGFFDHAAPKAKGAQVIGIFWEKIFYHPEQKIIWETPLGKGRILAIGGCLYYNQPNFYTKLLEQFTTNCLRFMCKDETTVKPMYWVDYQKSVMEPADEKYAPLPLEAPVKWNLPDKDIKLTRNAETYYCDLPTQRCLVVAQEKSGIDEIWTHPFMSLRDVHTYLEIQGVDTLVPLKSFQPEFQIRPNALIRTYHIGDLTLQEIITAKIEGPTVVVHYQWNGSGLN